MKTMLVIMSARTGDEDIPDDIQPESQSPITLAGQVRGWGEERRWGRGGRGGGGTSKRRGGGAG